MNSIGKHEVQDNLPVNINLESLLIQYNLDHVFKVGVNEQFSEKVVQKLIVSGKEYFYDGRNYNNEEAHFRSIRYYEDENYKIPHGFKIFDDIDLMHRNQYMTDREDFPDYTDKTIARKTFNGSMSLFLTTSSGHTEEIPFYFEKREFSDEETHKEYVQELEYLVSAFRKRVYSFVLGKTDEEDFDYFH